MINYTVEQTADMVKTARSSGAIGRDPLVYRCFRDKVKRTDVSVLDFGCGPKAAHATRLKSEGYNVNGLDLGLPEFVNTLSRSAGPYDVVLCSNVLNVQPSFHALLSVVYELRDLMKPGAMLIVNYPSSPRKAGLHIGDVQTALLEAFGEYTDKIKGYPGVMVVGA